MKLQNLHGSAPLREQKSIDDIGISGQVKRLIGDGIKKFPYLSIINNTTNVMGATVRADGTITYDIKLAINLKYVRNPKNDFDEHWAPEMDNLAAAMQNVVTNISTRFKVLSAQFTQSGGSIIKTVDNLKWNPDYFVECTNYSLDDWLQGVNLDAAQWYIRFVIDTNGVKTFSMHRQHAVNIHQKLVQKIGNLPDLKAVEKELKKQFLHSITNRNNNYLKADVIPPHAYSTSKYPVEFGQSEWGTKNIAATCAGLKVIPKETNGTPGLSILPYIIMIGAGRAVSGPNAGKITYHVCTWTRNTRNNSNKHLENVECKIVPDVDSAISLAIKLAKEFHSSRK